MRDETQKNGHRWIQESTIIWWSSSEVFSNPIRERSTLVIITFSLPKRPGANCSVANFRIESTEKKRQKTSLPVFQLPPGLSFHIGSPFASPVGVPDPKRSHNALEPSVPHLLARSSSANVHCSGRSSQIFPPQQHGMTQLISSWNSANLWCFSSISDKIPSFLASNLIPRQIQWASTVYNKLTQQCKIPVPL